MFILLLFAMQEFFQNIQKEYILWGIGLVFLVSVGIQLFYYLTVFRHFSFSDAKPVGNPQFPPVSIIICARNESENLQKHLPMFMELDYPEYEVIVVNDCSYDNSKEILEDFEKQYPNLRVSTLEEAQVYQHDKKFAVTIGIKAAKNEVLLFSDADCVPKSKNWIREMVSQYSPGKEIILGYGAFTKEKSFINKLIRFDAFLIALTYFSATLKGRPYMGIGRNLSYYKSLFFRNKGFASHQHIKSGDDDLFVNHVGTSYNTGICYTVEGHTVSIPKDNFNDWFEQKKRHLTTAPHYKPSDKAFLATQTVSAFLFYVLFIVLIVFQFYPPVVLTLFLVRFITQLIIFNKAMEKLDEKDLMWMAFVFDFFLVLIYPLLTLANTFNQETRWK